MSTACQQVWAIHDVLGDERAGGFSVGTCERMRVGPGGGFELRVGSRKGAQLGQDVKGWAGCTATLYPPASLVSKCRERTDHTHPQSQEEGTGVPDIGEGLAQIVERTLL